MKKVIFTGALISVLLFSPVAVHADDYFSLDNNRELLTNTGQSTDSSSAGSDAKSDLGMQTNSDTVTVLYPDKKSYETDYYVTEEETTDISKKSSVQTKILLSVCILCLVCLVITAIIRFRCEYNDQD